jgi:dienelactone hydrolase
MKKILIAAALILQAGFAHAAIQGETVSYTENGIELEGYLAYDDANETRRPGVLVVHEWKGLGDYAKRRARELAELGYIAFAADIYGKGVRPENHEEAGATAGVYKNDRSLMRERILAAFNVLKEHPFAEPSKIGAIGYCFGGTTVLELARSGADVKGVVSFHGSLSTPQPADAKNIKGKVLVHHGADDTFVPEAEIEAFKKEMADAGVDMRFVAHQGAVHSFTVPEAGDDPSKGMAYDEKADRASWESMKEFFSEVFA